MADVDQKEYRMQHLRLMQVILDQLAPFRLDLLGGSRKTVARQIHQIHFLIDVVVVDRLCFSRLRTGTRQ